MILSRYTLKNISGTAVDLPDEALFELPEKVLQFGTGVLLRGLPDYFIDRANRQGLFNGRIVVVKSTTHGDTAAFDKQDGLYTLCVRGLQNGEKVEENIVNASISRVLSAQEQWAEVLACAHNAHMEVIVSNTTEVGIELVNDDIRRHPPVSFPGKLLAFLYERFQAFGGSEHSGLVIVPTELIPDNGKKLEAIVLELAHLNGLEPAFIEWLECCNHFCNSLVDRIVPGRPDAAMQNEMQETLGYADGLLTVSEVYRLWAIEGGDHVRNILSFSKADEGVVIEPDIERYRELKLRLLNGTHTLSCGLAFLSGCETVQQAMQDDTVSHFIGNLMQGELAPSIPYSLPLGAAQAFGAKVLDRFRNPQIRHHWISITVQYSSKMKLRCVPVLARHYEQYGTVPEHFALGFAAYLCFTRPVSRKGDQYYGEWEGRPYLIQDDRAPVFYKRWAGLRAEEVVADVLRDGFWETPLHTLPGFEAAVVEKLQLMMNSGVKETIDALQAKKVVAA